jgi:hypothetical protein
MSSGEGGILRRGLGMPTGYTDGVTEETTFREFALKCARAFGALIMMRDDPMDTPIPDEFSPSDYHLKAIEALLKEQDHITLCPTAEVAAILEKHNAEARERREASVAESDKTRAAYRRMIGLVEQWTPPTPDHVRMKEFMLEQLTESEKWDCHDGEWYSDCYRIFEGTPDDWRKTRLANIERDLEYHRKHHQEELERARVRTAWVKALRESLEAEHIAQ